MNKTLEKHARTWLKENLAKCTEEQQHMFRRMYGKCNFDWTIDQIVDNMNVEDLDWSMTQVENTLRKNKKKTT